MSAPTSYSLPRIISVIVECMFYGAYVILFGLAVWLLPRKFYIPSVKKFIFPSIIALFALATLNIVYDLVGEAYAIGYTIPEVEKPWMIVGQFVDSITFVFADILGDSVLFYRVYAVWGSRMRVLFPMLLLIVSIKTLGILAAIVQIHYLFNEPQTGFFNPSINPGLWFVFTIVNAALSMKFMTGIIAGRVWWISRTIRKESSSFENHLSTWSYRTLAVITESGMIYPVYLTAEAILVSQFNIPNYVSMGTIVVGIAPTLIAVRVELGSAMDDQSLRSSLAFATRPNTLSTQVFDVVQTEGEDFSTR